AIRLISRIKTTLGVQLNIRDLFDNPTPADLDALVAHSHSLSKTDPLAPLLRLRGGHGIPLFCVHPGAGLGWAYSGLLRFLDARPVYALQAPGLSDPERIARSAEDLVADYLRQIRSAQPQGPYTLLGWSIGGIIAHMLAVRLQEEGEEVALLALLDSYPRIGPKGHLADARRADDVREIGRSIGHEISVDGSLHGVADVKLSALVNVFGNMRRTFSDAPLAVFDGDLLLFVATASRPENSPYVPELWRQHITGEIDVRSLNCAHGEMAQPGPLSRIGPVINERLSRALRRSVDEMQIGEE
ncbi:alpha/beta fold hydrolase, partial [Nonomuraea sp. NPDC002799]